MNLPKIAIIGAGNLSTKRIYPYIGVAGGSICGVCDLQKQKAEANPARWGGEVYTDWREMLAAQKPDGVIICIGPEQHATIAIEVMQAGFDIYTEKPPAESTKQAKDIATEPQGRRNVMISRAQRFRLCLKMRIWIRAALFAAGFVRLYRLISTG